MKTALRRTLALLAFLMFPIHLFAAMWETDFDRAVARARESGRYLLVNFSGSDWCGWCIKLDREVFSQGEFKKYARENLVLALIDFPRGKPQSRKDKQRNEALAQKYGVRGFPTVLVFSPSGDLIGHTSYQPGGAKAYVEHLREMIEKHRAANTSLKSYQP